METARYRAVTNAYAYVYNDPLNLVDPAGYFGIGDAVVWAAQNAPESWRPGIGSFARGSINFLDWWKSKPEDCDCSGRRNEIALAAAPWTYYPAVVGLGFGTTPAFKAGEYSVEYLSRTSFTWESAGQYTRNVSNWKITGTPAYTAKPGSSLSRQVVRNVRLDSPSGFSGFAGSVLLSGLLDAYFQFLADINNGLCLSPQQRAWRVIIAMEFGLLTGVLAAFAVAAAIYVGIPSLIAAGIGIGVGLGVNWVIKHKTPYNKEFYLKQVLENM